MEQLIFRNTKIAYEIKRSTRAKRINIRIDQDKVRVAVPLGITYSEAKVFVESKSEWILKHVQAWQSQNQQVPRKYMQGDTFLYQGKNCPLYTRVVTGRMISIKFIEGCLWAELPEVIPPEDWPQTVRGSLIKWYRVQAERVFQERLDYFVRIMGLKYNRLTIREQKTRWGSCSSKGNINLNWRIILAPEKVVDYLVVHELAHLRYMNHSQEFWCFVANYMPEYKVWKKWLKDNTSILNFDWETICFKKGDE